MKRLGFKEQILPTSSCAVLQHGMLVSFRSPRKVLILQLCTKLLVFFLYHSEFLYHIFQIQWEL